MATKGHPDEEDCGSPVADPTKIGVVRAHEEMLLLWNKLDQGSQVQWE
jgi:hypothetical protein